MRLVRDEKILCPDWLVALYFTLKKKNRKKKKGLQKMTRDDAKRMRQQSAAAPARLSQRERTIGGKQLVE